MEAAIFGLVGVLVGSAITVGGDFILLRRREAREEANAVASRSRELRLAARLVDAELQVTAAAAKSAIEDRRWYDGDPELTIAAFEQQRSVLAAHLSLEDWHAVVVASLAALMLSTESGAGITDVEAALIKSIADEVDAGRVALRPHM